MGRGIILTLALLLIASPSWARMGAMLGMWGAVGGAACPGSCTTQGQSETGTFDSYVSIGADSTVYWATRFISSATTTICGVDIYVTKVGSPTGNITSSIYSDSSLAPLSLVGSWSTGLSASAASTGYNKLTGQCADISNGTPYWIVVNYTGDASNYIRIGTTAAATTEALKFSSDGSSWLYYGELSFIFKLYE